MEQTATVEQAEPQGSAAPGQDTSAPANGDNGAATPASFGSLFKQRVFGNAARREARAGASSADRETSAADEQPAPSRATASRPGAADSDADGTASADASSPATESLSRKQRKALRTGQTAEDTATETVSADTSATPPPDTDPVVARVERVEHTVTEGLARLEGLLTKPTPAEADPSLDGESKAYRELFGDDTEFERRADIALHGSQRGQYLDTFEADELASWAANRKARDFTAPRATKQSQQFFSTAILAAAAEFGIDAASIQKPGTTFRDIFGAFVSHGETKIGADLAAANDKLAKLEAANRLLADTNEALEKRLPASARSVLRGGDAGNSRAAAQADRMQMNGRQAMRAGIQQREQRGRSGRPGAR